MHWGFNWFDVRLDPALAAETVALECAMQARSSQPARLKASSSARLPLQTSGLLWPIFRECRCRKATPTAIRRTSPFEASAALVDQRGTRAVSSPRSKAGASAVTCCTPNQPGLGDHVANCRLHGDAVPCAGRGIAGAMCAHSLGAGARGRLHGNAVQLCRHSQASPPHQAYGRNSGLSLSGACRKHSVTRLPGSIDVLVMHRFL